MAISSEVATRLCFVWNTERPLKGELRRSSVFSFLDAEWVFEMKDNGREYWVHLRRVSAWDDFHPFEITTWTESKRRTSKPISCIRMTFHMVNNWIWMVNKDFLLREMPEFKDSDDLTIICMIHAASGPGKKTSKLPQHQSIQDSLTSYPSLESLSLDSGSPPKREQTSHQSIQASLEFSPDLEGLSFDLGNLLEKGDMSDVELKCRDGIVPAHRTVLTARSEVFSAMFRNDMTERRSGVVDMPDMDSKILELLLKYMYTGKMSETSQDLIRRLYAASNKYAIHGLKKACSDWMTGDLTEENCLDYLVLADAHCDVSFKDAVVSFIVTKRKSISGAEFGFDFRKGSRN